MVAESDLHLPRYRSGAVARMLRLPVATLRIWERRYQVAAPATTEAGHRLYSSADVQRLALVKQLVDLGHAISSVASLTVEALQEVASTHASTMASTTRTALSVVEPAAARPAVRVGVVGKDLGERVARVPQARRQPAPWQLQVLGATLDDDALTSLAATESEAVCDVLLVHAPALHAEWPQRLLALAKRLGARQVAVVYGFAPAFAIDLMREAKVSLQREPVSDTTLGRWIYSLCMGLETAAAPASASAAMPEVGPVPPRRYDDAALADFAGLSSTIACECPRHVAELLMQLSHFEAYSAECQHRSPEDADLHAYLGQVSGTARALFEQALERIAIQEGLMVAR
ncbi:MerR family transcriptional regulator [Ideonella margarita]|uniref:MerR family transcriptional regulator n=1 Tax=Ideonella margarita TaxID=2984191 RepID=A0ABU9C482_9BURK